MRGVRLIEIEKSSTSADSSSSTTFGLSSFGGASNPSVLVFALMPEAPRFGAHSHVASDIVYAGGQLELGVVLAPGSSQHEEGQPAYERWSMPAGTSLGNANNGAGEDPSRLVAASAEASGFNCMLELDSNSW